MLQMCTINDSHMMYGSWDIECNGQNILSFWTVFCHFTSLTTQKIKILKNWRKNPRDIIILHKRNTNHDHMLCCSWDMACNGCNCYFSFWAILCAFTSLTAQNIKMFKKWKNHHEISLFYNNVPKIMIICYIVLEIWDMTDVIIFRFGPSFALVPKQSKF